MTVTVTVTVTATERRSTILAAAALAVFTVVVFGGVVSDRAAVLISNAGQCLAPSLAALACLGAARRAEAPSERRAWRLLGGSALSWAAGQVIWTGYEASDLAAPFPSLADAGFLLAVPLALAAVWTLAARSSTPSHLVDALDGLIIAGSLLSISWPLVLGPSWRAEMEGPFTLALSLAYPVGALVVATSVLMAIMRIGARRTTVPLPAIGVALLTLGLADSIFVWSTLQNNEQDVSPADLGWTGGYLILFLAALAFPRAGRRSTDGTNREAPGATPYLRALLPLGIAALALVVRVSFVVAGEAGDAFLQSVTVVTVALILARHLFTMRENQALTHSLEEKIVELTEREEQLSHQAFHDPLTGLANRRLFTDRVEHALSRSRRTGERTAVLFIDLDDFKVVNDSLGHGAGDRLLVAVGNRLTGCVRPGDTVARLGGDEFGVLLEEVRSDAEPDQVADRILAALDVPFPVDGRQVFTRASIGMAFAELEEQATGDHLLADADVALYAAKASGKARLRRFEDAMRARAVQRLELTQDLRQAIRDDAFLCHYQPIVDLVSGRIVAVEALVRWNHPTRGLLSPGDFIAMAEQNGVIGQIGMSVLRQAATQAARWREAGTTPPGFELHVNLSGRQLEDADLAEAVRRILVVSGLPAHLLVLEVTESVAVDIAARHLERLIELQALGVRLAIDDFGTGYSSLSYLRTLPVDVLKIDRAFAETLGDSTDLVLLEAIVKLGHSLGIEVVAEGIEREEQAASLRRMGCRRAQGYLFYRPVPSSEVPSLVRSSNGLGGPASAATRPMRAEPTDPG